MVKPAFTIGPLIDRRPKRAVYVIGPEVDVKRLLRLHRLLDKRNRFINKTFSDPRALHPTHALAQSFCIPPNTARLVRVLPGPQRKRQQLGPHALEVGERRVEAVIGNRRCFINISLTAHVPFTKMPRGIAGLLE